MSILVLGLGELGEEVVKSLATHPARNERKIAVLLRSNKPDQLRKLQQWIVDAIHADVNGSTEEELANTLRAYHTVICCTGMYLPPSIQIKIARAVLAAGVKRYFPWQFGIDYDTIGRNSSQDLFDSQLDVRDLLRAQSATQHVIVSTGMFISFLFEPSFGLVNAKRDAVTGIGSWENEITVTSPEDIGKVTAEIALVHPDLNGVVFVSGDTITMSGLADVVEQMAGKRIVRQLKTVSDLKQELDRDSNDSMKKYRVVFAEGVGVSWPKGSSFNETHGMATQTVASWAKRHM